ncbi:hypothetical protein LCGC14_2009760 [marine sediment metagenome]|uniref:Uncharacterized protein n=1 Tax=marine sediment metagenome TaxID=412755 RepID=A0A0F9HE28_9ZZZZ
MADAKTIDNLGPEVNNSYMRAMELLSEEEVKKIFQTPSIAKRAEVLTTAAQPLESDKLFGLKESESSPFAPPEDFVLAADSFSYQLVPSMGITATLNEKLGSLKPKDLSDAEKNQMKTLSKTFITMHTLNKILQDIQKRKDEYHKG